MEDSASVATSKRTERGYWLKLHDPSSAEGQGV